MKQGNTARRLVTLFTVLLGILLAEGLVAQDVAVRGRIVGADSQPLADQRVVLHRVAAAGGATIAEAVSGADGSFELRAAVPPDTGAVYFVAARYDEELYIGPPFRPTDEGAMEQVIQVGVPAMSATALLGDGEGPPMPRRAQEPSRTWMLLLIPLLGVAGVAAYVLIPRGSIPQERSLLIRVARLDERMATAPAAQKTTLLEERRQLIAQLRAD